MLHYFKEQSTKVGVRVRTTTVVSTAHVQMSRVALRRFFCGEADGLFRTPAFAQFLVE
jgi:hypothetical protein